MSEEVLAQGRFRVDRRRALEKMRKFQLSDPRAYTLELVAAAVVAGAQRIEVENDSDDFVLTWEAAGPSRDDLDGLFDHLFGSPSGPHAEMLQHLAIGIIGALGQSPRWVRVDRVGSDGALRLEVTDPTAAMAVPLAEPELTAGTRVHVKQRWSLANFAEMLASPLRAAGETRLLRMAARWCPVPLVIDGVPVARPEPPAEAHVRGDLWLVAAPASVDVVRHGVTVGTVERKLGHYWLGGHFEGGGLVLDASRARAVEDGAWASFVATLDDTLAELLLNLPPAAPADLCLAGIDWLLGCGRSLGPLADIAVLVDLRGTPWSARELRAHPGEVGWTPQAGLFHPDVPIVVFDAKHAAVVAGVRPGSADVTARLEKLAETRARRAKAEQARLDPWFPNDSTQRRFAEGPVRGAVRLREGKSGPISVRYQRDGVKIANDLLPTLGPELEAILDHPGFASDDSFTHVVKDSVRSEAEARLLAIAAEVVDDALPRLGLPGLTAAVRALMERGQTLEQIIKDPDRTLHRHTLFRRANGPAISLSDVVAGTGWLLSGAAPPNCPPDFGERVLLVPDEFVPAWAGWLGGRARDARRTLTDEVKGAIRRSAARRTPVLPGHIRLRAPVVLDGITGEVGFTWEDSPGSLEVLREGVLVCTRELPWPGVRGVIEWPGLAVTPAHDALARPADLSERMPTFRLAVAELIRQVWDAHGPVMPEHPAPAPVLDWLIREATNLPPWPKERVIAHTVSGAPITVGALVAGRGLKQPQRVKLLARAPGVLPGFDDAVVAGPQLVRALEALGATRRADEDLLKAEDALARFLARPAAPRPSGLASRVEEADGVRVCWFLPDDPDTSGKLVIEARWGDRVLSSRDRGGALGLFGVVDGPAILPAAGFAEVREPQRLQALMKPARAKLAELLAEALDAIASGEGLSTRASATWRALLSRLNAASDRDAAETAARDRIASLPIFTRLDGQRVSRTDLASQRKVLRVPMDFPAGPSDHPWYVREEVWVEGALAGMGVQHGGPALEAWRVGEQRRRTLPRRGPTVQGAVLERARFREGEVALRPPGAGGGLLVEFLVDGRALDPVDLPFPAPATALMEAAGVEPDPAFRIPVPGKARAAAEKRALEAAHTLARKAADAVTNGDLFEWCARYVLGEPSAADVPFFPTLGGRRVSMKELGARNSAGGVGVVARDARPLVAGRQPVVAPPWLREQLSARFKVVDLAEVVARHEAPAAAVPLRVPVPGHPGLGWTPGESGVRVCRAGVELARVHVPGPVPLTGQVEALEVEVDHLWRALLPGPALDALNRRLAEAARALEPHLVALSGGGVDDALRGALLALLDSQVSRHADLVALRASAKRDPTLRTLLELALYTDVTGATGSLLEVVDGTPVRFVAPGVRGRPLARRGRVWWLGEPGRTAVAKLRPTKDATQTLAEETAAQDLLDRGRGPPPDPPPGARVAALAVGEVRGRVWLAAKPDVGIRVRVDGAEVCRLAVPVPGMGGWVEGPFDVSIASLPAEVAERVRSAGAELLGEDALARLAAARDATGLDHTALMEAPLSPWSKVTVATDTAGAAMDLAALLGTLKRNRRIVLGGSGAVSFKGNKPERVVWGDESTRAALARVFPEADIVFVGDAEARAEARRAEEEANKAAKGRTEKLAAMRKRVGQLCARWKQKVPATRIESAVADWARDPPEGWPPFDAAEAESDWATLLAFTLATADAGEDGGRQTELVEAFAGALEDRR